MLRCLFGIGMVENALSAEARRSLNTIMSYRYQREAVIQHAIFNFFVKSVIVQRAVL
jgi:hypothetical protein